MIAVTNTGQLLSGRFAAAMKTNHSIVTKFEIWKQGGTAPIYQSANDRAGCGIISGSVTLTKTSDQRGQCQLTITSPNGSLIPTSTTSPITPWGNEIRIFSGVSYPDGTSEYVSMGYYRINQVQITESKGGVQIQISGYDRSRNINRNVIQYVWPDSAATANLFNAANPTVTWAQMIQFVCLDRWPYATFNDSPANWTLQFNDSNAAYYGYPHQPSFSQGTDMWSQMRQFAQAGGCDLYFDRYGVCTLRRDPVIDFFSTYVQPTAAVSFVEGVTATFDQFQRTLDDSAAYNNIVVYGSGDQLSLPVTSSPVANPPYTVPGGVPIPQGGIIVVDNDINSPTYIGYVDSTPGSATYGVVTGPSAYGVVTHIVNNNLLTTVQQCNDFAMLQLRLDIGAQENVTINSMMVDPRLEVDDCVQFTRTRDGVVNVKYLVQSLTIPLAPNGVMQMTVREKRNLS